MRCSRAVVTALFLVACLALAGSSSGQERKKEPVDRAVSGEVTVVDPIAHTLSLRDPEGRESTFRVNDDTTILVEDRRIPLDQIHAGDHVAVDVDNREGVDVATYIEVVEGPKR
jgi:hypothetical protein